MRPAPWPGDKAGGTLVALEESGGGHCNLIVQTSPGAQTPHRAQLPHRRSLGRPHSARVPALPMQKRRKGRQLLEEDASSGQPLTVREEEPLSLSVDDAPSSSGQEISGGEDSRNFAVAMAALAHETKAEDVLVLHVAPLIFWTEYMVFITVFSRPQLGAVLGKIEKEAAERWGRTINPGAKASRTEWECLDLGDIVVHVFTERERAYYDLEAFYSAAEQVDLPFVQTPSDARQPNDEEYEGSVPQLS